MSIFLLLAVFHAAAFTFSVIMGVELAIFANLIMYTLYALADHFDKKIDRVMK